MYQQMNQLVVKKYSTLERQGKRTLPFLCKKKGKNMKIVVKNDVFDIVERIKAIDNDYFVIFDTKRNLYELHCKNQYENSFCLTLFESLDERSIQKTLKTRRQNKEKLFEEIKRHNQKMKGGNYES